MLLLQGFDEDLLAMLRQQYPGAHTIACIEARSLLCTQPAVMK